MMEEKTNILLAGIGGASLGTELFKSLKLSDNYNIFGCDISEFAYGHYQEGFIETFLISRDNYLESITELCLKNNIKFVVPGGEEPTLLLNQARELLSDKGIKFVGNSDEVIRNFTDKKKTFQVLSKLGFDIPLTKFTANTDDLDDMIYPCIIKPSKGTGGSVFVFIAKDKKDAELYVNYLIKVGKEALLQEYLPLEEGEYTIGLVSSPNQELIRSIVLKRQFNAKLSITSKSNYGIISSPYSQGLIDEFPHVKKTSEDISRAIGSAGPLDIQGRIKEGVFIPFEINPRFSGSTYLRALAGFNEADIFIKCLRFGKYTKPIEIFSGYCIRSLSEKFIMKKDLKK